MGLGAYLAAATERQHWEAEYKREKWEVDHCYDREREEIYEIFDRYGISRDGARGVVNELCVTSPKGKERWVKFMMDFELQLPEPDTSAAWKSAVTMGLSYFIGGLVPMIPYFVMDSAQLALFVSIAITVVILLLFGYVKSWYVDLFHFLCPHCTAPRPHFVWKPSLPPIVPHATLVSSRRLAYSQVQPPIYTSPVANSGRGDRVTIRTKRAGFWGALQTLLIGAAAAATSYVIVRLLDSGDGQP